MSNVIASLAELSDLAPREFIERSYAAVLGRAPTADEYSQMLAALLTGDTQTWLLGRLCYGAEGRGRSISVPGLRARYLVQRLFRLPGVGRLLEWLSAFVKLPSSLRVIRASFQRNAFYREGEIRRIDLLQRQLDETTRICAAVPDLMRRSEKMQEAIDDLGRRLASAELLLRDGIEKIDAAIRTESIEVGRLKEEAATLALSLSKLQEYGPKIEHLGIEEERLASSFQATRAKFESILPPSLADTLEVEGEALVARARERCGVPPDARIASLPSGLRYSMFEAVFYESPAVAAKQRIYTQYLKGAQLRQRPFLDLGCGRGEFLQILRDEGIESVGVDSNRVCVDGLRQQSFNVLEHDLVAFLETDRQTYSGASLLQVAEHLTSDQIDRVLLLLFERLAPGAVLILETPNTLSPFAMAVFHTDSTHRTPLPPERLRYEVEAAGFERTRTLYQARIPKDQFAGPDPRAYYADYAIIAWRP